MSAARTKTPAAEDVRTVTLTTTLITGLPQLLEMALDQCGLAAVLNATADALYRAMAEHPHWQPCGDRESIEATPRSLQSILRHLRAAAQRAYRTEHPGHGHYKQVLPK